jgi:heterotetrameric sarcosine oxidase beta subunit
MKKSYDAVIIGGGAQGLSLAYNLARKGLRNLAVLDKSYPGSGASGRNGEMIRSAFASEEWIRFFDASLRIWQTLSRELDFNLMFNRRGYLVLASSPEELEICRSGLELQKACGLNTKRLDAQDVRKLIPALNPEMAVGGVLQPDAGFARHDALVWAYGRAVNRFGVDIFSFTEVTGIGVENGKAKKVVTTRGRIETPIVINAAGGQAADIAQMAGVQLPSDTYRLEMLVTEPIKPFLTPAVASLNIRGYMHQTTRGEFSGGTEVAAMEPSNSLKSTLRLTRDMVKKFVHLFPGLAGVRLMRQWGGLVDMTADVAPVLGPAPEVEGFILDCGWVYGFMGAPAAGKFLADYILTGKMPAEIAAFGLKRFEAGKLVPDKSLLVST